VAVAAIDALGRLGDPGAAGPLVAALGSDDLKVKEHAITALGKIGDPGAIDPLIAKLQDRSEAFYIRKKAARTLNAIYKQGRLDAADRDKVLSHWHSWYLL
jgi:HEAT repeat protein